MTSLPPQQPSRRSQSSQEQQDESPSPSYQQIRLNDSEAHSSTSLDSQTVFLNSSAAPTSDSKTAKYQSIDASSTSHNHARSSETLGPSTDNEPRKCWICFSDETEDTPQTSPWRSPCPCALTAHEACLLDWIADIESPGSARSTAIPQEITCPQCKSRIYLARPRSNLVEAYGMLEKYASKLLLPAFATGTVYTLLLVMSRHGEHTIGTVFNAAEAEAILAPRTYGGMNWLEREALARFPSVFGPFFRNWRGLRVEIGLPVIPAALIASRTTFADAVLPVLPILFFATHAPSSQTLSIGYWPPSAALTLVALPYIRSAYDEYLERVWGDRERRWVKEIAPRLGDREEQGDGNNVQQGGVHDDDDFEQVFEVELNLGIGNDDDDEEGDGQDEQDNREAAPAPDVPVADRHRWNQAEPANNDLAEAVEVAVEAQAREDAEREGRANNHNNNNNQNRERAGENRIDLVASAHSVADTVFGALLFPSIASASGELLRLLLPSAWTVAPKRSNWGPTLPTGLLQTKWGRSIVGGCLFVVLKDAVRIYCRWWMAVSFRERRVRDYDKKLGKLV